MSYTNALTKKQINGYRQWLSELDEEAHDAGKDIHMKPDPDIWELFDPGKTNGKQIYLSYTDRELLGIVVKTMDCCGHKPRWDEVHYIYLAYIRERFGNLNHATWKARGLRKQMEEEARWPPDWPQKVSIKDFERYCEKRKCALNDEEREVLLRFCNAVKKNRRPPLQDQIPRPVAAILRRRRIQWKQAMNLMEIPALNKLALKHLMQYWTENWSRKGENEI